MESTLRAGAGAAGLRLIETLLWDGRDLVRLPLHLDRLCRSADLLGWTPGRAAAESALHRLAKGPAARLRLTLAATGQIEVHTAALPPTKPLWAIGLADARLHSADPWLRVKSSNRASYDTARAALPPGLDEVIFANEKGEVCDGSITTLFFDRGAGMRTPPLTAGLLPGVLRASLGLAEEPLLLQDLPHVRLWIGNSLRGLIPAVWNG